MEKSTNFKYILISIIFLFLLTNCEYYKTKNLSKKINLKEIISNNDSVEFFIQKIVLYDTKIMKTRISPTSPSIILFIKIRNKTDKDMLFKQYDDSLKNFSFVGILKNDTIGFTDFYKEFVIPPYKDTIVGLESVFSSFYMVPEYESDQDNTKVILNLAEQMDFYYMLRFKISMPWDSSVIVLKNKYPLGMSNKTKVISRNRNQLYFP